MLFAGTYSHTAVPRVHLFLAWAALDTECALRRNSLSTQDFCMRLSVSQELIHVKYIIEEVKGIYSGESM